MQKLQTTYFGTWTLSTHSLSTTSLHRLIPTPKHSHSRPSFTSSKTHSHFAVHKFIGTTASTSASESISGAISLPAITLLYHDPPFRLHRHLNPLHGHSTNSSNTTAPTTTTFTVGS